ISGTPTTDVGSPFNFSVTVKDNVGSTSAAKPLSIAILPAPPPAGPSITTSSLPDGQAGTPYPYTILAASGGTPPYGNWAVSTGALPPGLLLNALTSTISGTPTTAAGSPFNFSVTVKDSVGSTSAAKPLSIAILAAAPPGAPSITTSSLPG